MDRRRRPTRRCSPHRFFLLVGSLLTLLLVGFLHLALHVPRIWSYLLAVNVTTAALYAYDKRSATVGRLRVPERILHLWALLGGTPAAFASQRLLRHKILKGSFRTALWAILSVQGFVAAGWWYATRS